MKLQGIELKAAEPLRIASARWRGNAGAGSHHRAGYGYAGERDGAVVWVDGSEGRQAGCEGDGECEHDAAAYVRLRTSSRRGKLEFTVGGGWAGDESGADGQGAVRQGEHRDGWGSEWVEQYERDAGVQRRPAAGGEPDGDDGWRHAEAWRVDSLQERRLCGSDCDGRCGAGAVVWVERDGECESEAAGRHGERDVERNDSDDAVWDWPGCGFCGVRVAGRRECAA